MKPASDAPIDRLFACWQLALGHDLPNKLVALQGMSRLLADELPETISQDGRTCLERLQVLSRRIHEQVAVLADAGRIFNNPGPVVALDLGVLWMETAAEMKCRTEQRAIEFVVAEPIDSLRLPARAARRVLTDMTVHLCRRAPSDGRLRLELSRVGFEVVLLDDGPAPPSSALERSFEPSLEDPNGPHLGLFLARLLAENWGGSLRADAPPQGGCRLVLSCPTV